MVKLDFGFILFSFRVVVVFMLRVVFFLRKEKFGYLEFRWWEYRLGGVERDGAGNGRVMSGWGVVDEV